ncbi:isocitrate lyase/PEP mutase family protein [Roseibium sediminis]|uniref:isocitrate lyase/PEP mutase family protein n=1 Tax=Roseibium sediminis TaxID=1775174 RepID=UPI00123DFC8A|nr:isocitrate lyase/phosphoenolpyruvate mutase family protein [Roseibium sediminis]
MSTIEQRRARFREMHNDANAFLMPNPFGIGTAQILEGLGFDCLATTSAGHAFSLGYRDAEGFITREMALLHAAEIVNATTLPVNGDLENGFGDSPNDVADTIEGAIEAGLAGCSIEDYSQDPDNPYYSLEHSVERIAAAVETKNRIAPDFVLTARSEAPIQTPEDLAEAIKRLQAYSAVGADCLYAPDLLRIDDIKTVLGEIDKPLNLLAGRRHFNYTRKELAELGVARISIGAGLARVAYGAFVAAAESIVDGGTFAAFGEAVGFKEFDSYLKGRKSGQLEG